MATILEGSGSELVRHVLAREPISGTGDARYRGDVARVSSEDDLVKTKFGEYGEMQKGWTAEDAKGFIKVLSTPLRVYYTNHKDEEI